MRADKAGAGGAGLPLMREGRRKARGLRSRNAGDLAGADGVPTEAGEMVASAPEFVSFNEHPHPTVQELTLDLFGMLTLPRQKPVSRNRHKVSPTSQARVAELRTRGLSIAAIARETGLSRCTLFRHYSEQLGSKSLARLRFADPSEAASYPRPERGRPCHVPTIASSALVRELVDQGKSLAAIARSLGISGPTLHRHYRREIGRSKRGP